MTRLRSIRPSISLAEAEAEAEATDKPSSHLKRDIEENSEERSGFRFTKLSSQHINWISLQAQQSIDVSESQYHCYDGLPWQAKYFVAIFWKNLVHMDPQASSHSLLTFGSVDSQQDILTANVYLKACESQQRRFEKPFTDSYTVNFSVLS